MTRRLYFVAFLLTLLLPLPSKAQVQYWFDNDREQGGTITGTTASIDVSTLNVGLHVLHLQSTVTDTLPSTIHSRYFLRTIDQPDNVELHYWFDNDKKSGKVLTGAVTDIDVSTLPIGLHTLHVQGLSNTDPSTIHCRYFLRTLDRPDNVTQRYWFDNDQTTGGTLDGEVTSVDVSSLPRGLHALHIQGLSKGDPSATHSHYFIKTPQTSATTYVCHTWVDSTYHSRDEVECDGGILRYTIDTSRLKPGDHELYAVLVANDGTLASTPSAYFIKSKFSLIIAAGETFVCDEESMFAEVGLENDETEGLYAALFNIGTMSADSVWVGDNVPADKWTFISLPFSVKMDGIMHDNASVQYAIRRYDGAGRAQNGIAGIAEGGTTSNWKRVQADETLAAGEGFILQHNAASGSERFVFPASDNLGTIFASGDVTVPLAEHPSAYRCNAGWNLIGNPYPCYYDMSHSDFTAPVTIWNGEGYDAYRPHDDEVVLHPFEAFFVQRQEKEAITFKAPSPVPPRGEAVTNDSDKRTGTEYSGLRTGTRQSSIPFSGTRTLINLSVHALPHGEGRGGGFEVRTRLVLNAQSSRDYEPECDAAKFFGGSIDLYTIEHGTAYAINERPLDDGIVSVGFSCAEAGTYTITSDRPVTLIDKQLGTTAVLGLPSGTAPSADCTANTPATTAYTFTAPAGNTASRFELRLGDATCITPAPAATSDSWHTISGVRLGGKPTRGRGVYIHNGRKVVVTQQ